MLGRRPRNIFRITLTADNSCENRLRVAWFASRADVVSADSRFLTSFGMTRFLGGDGSRHDWKSCPSRFVVLTNLRYAACYAAWPAFVALTGGSWVRVQV